MKKYARSITHKMVTTRSTLTFPTSSIETPPQTYKNYKPAYKTSLPDSTNKALLQLLLSVNRFTKFSDVSNSNHTLYGAPGTKFRRRVQNRHTYLKEQQDNKERLPNFLKYCQEQGVGTTGRNESSTASEETSADSDLDQESHKEPKLASSPLHQVLQAPLLPHCPFCPHSTKSNHCPFLPYSANLTHPLLPHSTKSNHQPNQLGCQSPPQPLAEARFFLVSTHMTKTSPSTSSIQSATQMECLLSPPPMLTCPTAPLTKWSMWLLCTKPLQT
jgi:hypothetical protein